MMDHGDDDDSAHLQSIYVVLRNFDSINILEDHRNIQHSHHTLLKTFYHKIASLVKNGGCFDGSVEIYRSQIKWFLFLDEMLVGL